MKSYEILTVFQAGSYSWANSGGDVYEVGREDGS
jgi:hypothetical protein